MDVTVTLTVLITVVLFITRPFFQSINRRLPNPCVSCTYVALIELRCRFHGHLMLLQAMLIFFSFSFSRHPFITHA